MANWDRFDAAFECPDIIKNEKIRGLYEGIYAEVRAECQGLDLSTGFVMRASLMLDSFIKHQNAKRLPYAEEGGYSHPGQEKDAVACLTGIIKDYDDLLIKSRPKETKGVSPEAVRDALVMVLRRIEDQDLRVRLQMQFVSELERIGL